jgi:hypothetical protein
MFARRITFPRGRRALYGLARRARAAWQSSGHSSGRSRASSVRKPRPLTTQKVDVFKAGKAFQSAGHGFLVRTARTPAAVDDDNPRPVPGAQGYDTSAYARVDAHTINARYLKDGKVVQTRDVDSIAGRQYAHGKLCRHRCERTAEQRHCRLRQAVNPAAPCETYQRCWF